MAETCQVVPLFVYKTQFGLVIPRPGSPTNCLKIHNFRINSEWEQSRKPNTSRQKKKKKKKKKKQKLHAPNGIAMCDLM
jgi:hypothetical protein